MVFFPQGHDLIRGILPLGANMNTELQTDEPEVLDTEETELVEAEEETIEEASDSLDEDQDPDSAPDTEEAQAGKFTEAQQKIVDDAIGKKVFKLREKEREADSLKKQLNDLKAKIPEEPKPVVPPPPDPFSLSDDEYKRNLALRDEALRQESAYNAKMQADMQLRLDKEKEAEKHQQQALQEKVEVYSQRATRLGIKPEELQAAGNTVATWGIDDSVVNFILDLDQGPLVTTYLSKNLTELEALRDMRPMEAAVHINSKLLAKAEAFKPKVKTAPPPVEQPQSSGTPSRNKGPKGATFE